MSGRVFITGGSGLLALNWALALRERLPVTLGLHDRQAALASVETHPSNLDTVDQICRTIDAIQPRMVVHTAGLTNVEKCEADPGLAQHVNVDLAVNVAVACAARGVPLVHVSTDHLFRGDEALVSEAHPPAPQNTYGRTKAEAEWRVLDAHPNSLVVRTNFYGWGPTYRRSFSDRVLDVVRRGEAVTLFADVFHTPILAEVLSLAVHELSDLRVSGIVHVVGNQRISKYEFGLKIATHFHLDPSLIRPGLLADQPELVQRPRDMSLSNHNACRILGRDLGDVDAHLQRLQEQERLGLARELQDL